MLFWESYSIAVIVIYAAIKPSSVIYLFIIHLFIIYPLVLQIQVGSLIGQFFSILSRHRVKLDSQFANVMVSVVVVEGLGRSLNPDVDILAMVRQLLLSPFWPSAMCEPKGKCQLKAKVMCVHVTAEHCLFAMHRSLLCFIHLCEWLSHDHEQSSPDHEQPSHDHEQSSHD